MTYGRSVGFAAETATERRFSVSSVPPVGSGFSTPPLRDAYKFLPTFNIYARGGRVAISALRIFALVVIISGGDATAIVALHRYVTKLIFHPIPSSFN